MKRFFVLLLLALLLSQASAHACLNDRDTLAEEIKGLPDVVQVVTGRFERNPPLYYQMRLARVAAELKTHPTLLSDYDDAGVACDRLGRDDEAIAWMDKKRARLLQANAADPALKEHWYRYNANTGTFWVHRWLRAGANRHRIGEVQKAREYIAEAIKIKPDAHFGREKYQLQVMDWIVKGQPYLSPNTWETAVDFDGRARIVPQADPTAFLSHSISLDKDSTKALCGLITLGSAWESVDIFDALGHSLPYLRGQQLRYLTELRCRELIGQGHGSLVPGAPKGEDLVRAMRLDKTYHARQSEDERLYRQLRAEADDWQKKRTDYMMARLTAGRHPDTDPSFWNDYHDTGPPQIGIPWERRFYLTLGPFLGMPEEVSDVLWLMFLLGSGLLLRRFWLRHRKGRTPKITGRT